MHADDGIRAPRIFCQSCCEQVVLRASPRPLLYIYRDRQKLFLGAAEISMGAASNDPLAHSDDPRKAPGKGSGLQELLHTKTCIWSSKSHGKLLDLKSFFSPEIALASFMRIMLSCSPAVSIFVLLTRGRQE